jgi:steroid delta-isomerase-like uncharacterized protein
MAADLKALIRRGFEEGINQRRMDVFDELLADDYVNHTFPAPAPGREGFKQVVQTFIDAFPDFHVVVEEMVAEGDAVASRGTMSGTHRGDFMGIAATGRQIAVGYSDIWRFRDGRAAENWVQLDLLGLMQQLGAVPMPDSPATA